MTDQTPRPLARIAALTLATAAAASALTFGISAPASADPVMTAVFDGGKSLADCNERRAKAVVELANGEFARGGMISNYQQGEMTTERYFVSACWRGGEKTVYGYVETAAGPGSYSYAIAPKTLL